MPIRQPKTVLSMNYLKYTCAALALGTSLTVGAQSTSDVVLSNFVVWSDTEGNGIIRVTAPNQTIVNNWGCTDPDSYMALATLTKEAQSRLYATLLTAKALGKPITLRLGGCQSNRPAIMNVYF